MTLFELVVGLHKFRRILWQRLATNYQAKDIIAFRRTWSQIESINNLLEALEQPVQLDSALEQ